MAIVAKESVDRQFQKIEPDPTADADARREFGGEVWRGFPGLARRPGTFSGLLDHERQQRPVYVCVGDEKVLPCGTFPESC